MGTLNSVAIPIIIAILAALPGIAGLWLVATDREKKRAETHATIVATALSLVVPLEERIAKQSLYIDELQSAIEAKDKVIAIKNEIISELSDAIESKGSEAYE